MSTLLDPIAVTFDGQSHSFSFDPETRDAPCEGHYTLTWHLSTVNGGGQEAIFVAPYVEFAVPEAVVDPFGTPIPSGGDQTVTVVDNYDESSQEGAFHYTVTVKFAGQTYTSDPMIVNKSPTPNY